MHFDFTVDADRNQVVACTFWDHPYEVMMFMYSQRTWHILTPAGLDAGHTIAAMRTGRHVLVEMFVHFDDESAGTFRLDDGYIRFTFDDGSMSPYTFESNWMASFHINCPARADSGKPMTVKVYSAPRRGDTKPRLRLERPARFHWCPTREVFGPMQFGWLSDETP